MIQVNYNEITKKLNVKLNNNSFNKVVEKNSYTLFFNDSILVQYIINDYQQKNYVYNKKLLNFLGKKVFYFFA